MMEITQHPKSAYYYSGIGWAIHYRTRKQAHAIAKKYQWTVYKYKKLAGFFVQDGPSNQAI